MESSTYWYNSPLGSIQLFSSDDELFGLYFRDGTHESSSVQKGGLPHLVFSQLHAYFSGDLLNFDIPLNPQGTAFQQSVWKMLLSVPFGKTMGYLELAKKMGDAKKIRAVANANAKNPISIIIPCHRIIGSDGSLTGYAGGLHRKKWLLEHEQKTKQLSLFDID